MEKNQNQNWQALLLLGLSETALHGDVSVCLGDLGILINHMARPV